MGDFLRFEVMITPILIQILFWIVVAATVIMGIVMIFTTRDAPGIAAGGLVIIFGPIAARIYAEILIVLFRINDHLRRIQHNTEHS
ncbi:MAG TPA: DUF4282 domain-containing protein [Stellaceae bacterium]|nr:DUF4282 domain-containing protein [Stellaceae bacterium]